MPIRVKCEQCKKTLSVKDHLAGKKIKCPVCQTPVTVGPAAPAGGPPDAAPSKPAAPNPAAPAASKKPAVLGKPVARPAADRSKTNGASHPKKNGTPVDPGKNGTPALPPDTIDRPPESAEAEALALFSEELKPKEEDGPPKMIDFTCEHCEQELHLPLEEGGKRMQCPNPECRQLIKVPMPKIEGKKDWRKMDRVGPAAALVNQPEQLEDAWGSQNATKARQDSLAQAGALKVPPKPKRDATAWLAVGAKWIGGCAILLGLAFLIWTAANTKKQHGDLHDLEELVDLKDSKIANPILRAEAKRVLALLYLRESKGAIPSERHIKGATVDIDEKSPSVNEQLFLINKAFTLIDQGGEPEEVEVLRTRRKWDDVSVDLVTTLNEIRDAHLRAVAVRQVVTRLLQKKKDAIAMQLAGQLAAAVEETAPVVSQNIALRVLADEQEAISEFAENLPLPPLELPRIADANIRRGFAEGYARKGEFDKAAKIALADGPNDKDRVEACLGVAAIALAAKKNDEAAKCAKEALKYSETADRLTDWNVLELVQLSARTEDAETTKKLLEKIKAPEFKTRALLEIFLAKCEKATGRIAPVELADLEASATKDDYVPLALAWEALARHNARLGASRNDNRKTFDARYSKDATIPEGVPAVGLLQMVDVGTYLGSLK